MMRVFLGVENKHKKVITRSSWNDLFEICHLRWFGISLSSLSSLYSASNYTLRTERKCSRGEHFWSMYASITRSNTDAITLLRLCEMIARNSKKIKILGSVYFAFFWKNENRDPQIFLR